MRFFLFFIMLFSLMSYGETLEEEDSNEKSKQYIFLEYPLSGYVASLSYPSRMLSVRFTGNPRSKYGFLVEPILGVNLFTGAGASVGFFYKKSNTVFFGPKLSIYLLNGYGVAKEIFFDIDKYIYVNRALAIKLGTSIGYGVAKAVKAASDGGVHSVKMGPSIISEPPEDPTKIRVDNSFTLRFHIDLSYKKML